MLVDALADPAAGNVSLHDLERQVLLHLPKFDCIELARPEIVSAEAKRLAFRLSNLRSGYESFFRNPALDLSTGDTYLDRVSDDLAEAIHERFHYLCSFRRDAIHLGLWLRSTTGEVPRLVSLLSLSPFDLEHIKPALPEDVDSSQVKVLSRLYSFDWAPKNTMSFFIGRAFAWVKQNLPGIRMLVTYLDPNLGFRGSVYKATNWLLWCLETSTRYLYLNGNYITDRAVKRQFGTYNIELLNAVLGPRLRVSLQPLKPLQILAYFMEKGLTVDVAGRHIQSFERPTSR